MAQGHISLLERRNNYLAELRRRGGLRRGGQGVESFGDDEVEGDGAVETAMCVAGATT
jgi:hypothetical protein